MVEQSRRDRVGDHPRATSGTEWEVFVRDRGDDPLRHVGSVTAPDADAAHETATTLFGWYADDVWLCPAEAVCRYSTHDLDDEADSSVPEEGDEPRQGDPDPVA
ncbi:MAG: Htur_1727 family rSAM-partnered candidate RiPP [Halobacteriaceae archaeon]